MMIANIFVGILKLIQGIGQYAFGIGAASAAKSLPALIIRGAALFAVGSLLAKKPNRKGLLKENRNLTHREAAAPREIVYGFIRKGGTLSYMAQHGDGFEFLSFVIVLADHECEAIHDVFFNNENLDLAAGSNDSNGITQWAPAATNRFAGVVRVKKHLGADTQDADADLVSDTLSLAADKLYPGTAELKRCAYVVVRIKQFAEQFQGQVPNVSVELQGKKDIYNHDATGQTFTVTTGTDKVNITAHGFSDGDRLRFSTTDTLPAPTDANDTYFVINKTANAFEISNEQGGAKIDITSTGSGTHTVRKLVWTANSALCAANYLEDKEQGGKEKWGDIIDETSLTTANSECDELVDIDNTATFTVDTVNNEVDWTAHGLAVDDRVRLSTTGTLPPIASGSLAANTPYFVVAVPTVDAFQIAADLRGTAIDFTGAGSGTHTATQCEPRYECHGVLYANRARESNLEDIVMSMMGKRVPVGGKMLLHAGMYFAPTITLDEDHIRAPIRVRTGRPKADLFNGVRAVIVSAENNWQAGDAPPYNRRKTQTFSTADVNTGTDTITITAHGYRGGDPIEFSGSDLPSGIDTANTVYYVRDKATNTFKTALTPNGVVVDITDVGSGTHTAIHDPYLSVDLGTRIYRDIEFKLVKSPYHAQRLMKILLERNRQQISVLLPCFMAAFQLQAANTFSLDNTRLGWTGKVYEIAEAPWVLDNDENGEPFYGVDIEAQETASAIYDWSTTDELPVDLAADTNLHDIPTPADVHFDLMLLFRNLAQTGGVLSWPFYDLVKDDTDSQRVLPENALHYRLSPGNIEGIFRKPGHMLDGYYQHGSSPATDSANVTGDTANDELDGTNSLIEDRPLILTTTGTLPKPLIPYLKYWIINRAAATVQISRERGGSVVDIINTGSGTHTYWAQYNARIAREGTHGRGVLIEEARKSFLRQSNQFNHADWTLTKLTAEAGAGNQPISFLDLTEDGTTGNHQIAQDARATMSSYLTAVASIWVRPDNRTKFKIFITRKDGANKGAAFTLTGDGTVASQDSATSASIRKISHAGSDVYRLALSCSISTGGTTPRATFRVLDDSGNDSFAGNSLRACEAIDFQMEETTHGGETNAKNPPVSSLLRTTTTLFNRSADVLYARTLYPWFNFVEGTVYIEFTIDYVAIDDIVEHRPEQVLWNFSDDTADERLYAYIWEDKIRYQSIRSGSQDFEISETISPGTHKLAVTYKQGGPFRFLLDNGDFQEQATGNMPESITAFNTGCSQVPDSQLNGFVAHILVLPWRAKDQMMRRMTEPDA